MTLLIAGLLLWIAAHWFKRLAPDARARIGDRGKGVIALLLGVAVVMMVLGYDPQSSAIVWSPPVFMWHINNLLMLLALWTFATSQTPKTPVWPATVLRHPMLVSAIIWAVAHLLVNGELQAIVLFGGLLFWAASEIILINRAEPEWTPPAPASSKKVLLRKVVVTLVLLVVIAAIHIWLGRMPFMT